MTDTTHPRRRKLPWIAGFLAVLILLGGTLVVHALHLKRPGPGRSETDDPHRIAQDVLQKTCRALYASHVRGDPSWDELVARCASLEIDPESRRADYLEASRTRLFAEDRFRYSSPEFDPAREKGDPSALFGTTRPYGDAGFFVHVRRDAPGAGPVAEVKDTLIVQVTVTMPDGRESRLEATVGYRESLFSPAQAMIATDGLAISGSPVIEGKVLARRASIMGSPTLDFQPIPAEFSVPDIVPEDYAPLAEARLLRDGIVLDRAGKRICDAREGTVWRGLRWTSTGGWSAGSHGAPLVVFVEGDFVIAGSVERSLTVFATGSIAVGGSVNLTPAIGETLFVAGGDVRVSAPSDARLRGLIAAREQVALLGSARIDGTVVAQDATDLRGLVRRRDEGREGAAAQVGGHIRLHFIPGLTTILRDSSSGVVVLSVTRLN